MPPIVSFIGWHNSGKTTFASQVIHDLQHRGYTVAVIKSTKDHNIAHDQSGTDTAIYRKAGATAVMLAAPDQMFLQTGHQGRNLTNLAHRYFPNVDIVIAEGFKDARQIPKIEVTRGETDLLRDQVNGVIAIATDRHISGDYIFGLDESNELADFLEQRFLKEPGCSTERVVLMVDGKKITLNAFTQDILATTVTGLVNSLKKTKQGAKIELQISNRQHNIPDAPSTGNKS